MSAETELFEKWIDGTLTREDILVEVSRLADNISTGPRDEKRVLSTMLSQTDLQHIARCLHNIYLWWRDDRYVGSFLRPFVENNLTRTFQTADSTNWTGLAIYIEYLHWHAPATWRHKQRKDYDQET